MTSKSIYVNRNPKSSKIVFLFNLIFSCQALPFINLRRKKIFIVLFFLNDNLPDTICGRWEKIWERQREKVKLRQGKCFYALHDGWWETQTKWQLYQKPDFTNRIWPLNDTRQSSMVTNWEKPVVPMEWWWQIQYKQQIFSETKIYAHLSGCNKLQPLINS